MIIHLPYGKKNLVFDMPDSCHSVIIEPSFSPALGDPVNALKEALKKPIGSPSLHSIIQPTDRVGIIFNDITRPTPSSLILHTILQELSNIPHENISLFNALGTHRFNTKDELRQMLDDELVDNYRIIQNNAFDPAAQIHLGTTKRGHEIWLNRELLDCDVKILTGFIEPHFFAGFSGGGKAIMPGMAGLVTILGNHSAQMIADPNATWGITWGNPIWEEVREIALMVERIFLVNVTLNKNKEITGMFCGELGEAHSRGCEFVKKTTLVRVSEPFDMVITTNSGYPLDINLYQSVKGMSAASQIVKQGGAIIIATECRDGIPEHGMYGNLLKAYKHPKDLLKNILSFEPACLDQWQVQIQAMLQLKADIYVYSDGLTDSQIRSTMLLPCRSIEATLAELLAKYGPQARICILPEGPQTIPYIT
ncbi:MAG: nickel-dependent lactate racemase [Anaerolineales bacterium]|jgi:nickel-dependent lactate racemase